MTDNSVDLARVPGDNPVRASPDLLRAMVQTFAEALIDADADALCGVPYGQPSAERVNYRNGYRQRCRDIQADTEPVAFRRGVAGHGVPDGWMARWRSSSFGRIATSRFCFRCMREWLPDDHVVRALLG
jgi:transposase-like protein